MKMQLQRSHLSIVRSIRQISLVRDWFRARGDRALPGIAAFEPDERSGDTLDLSIFKVVGGAGRVDFICLQAGDRVRAIHGEALADRALGEFLTPPMAAAAAPIWSSCVVARLPVYAIVAVNDQDGRPVTIEQVFLPYTRAAAGVDFIVSSLHAWSTEGRFTPDGLMRVHNHAPTHWAAVLDPDSRRMSKTPLTTGAPGGFEDVSWADDV